MGLEDERAEQHRDGGDRSPRGTGDDRRDELGAPFRRAALDVGQRRADPAARVDPGVLEEPIGAAEQHRREDDDDDDQPALHDRRELTQAHLALARDDGRRERDGDQGRHRRTNHAHHPEPADAGKHPPPGRIGEDLGHPVRGDAHANIIQASLPMLDGQNTSDGRKNSRWAYDRRRPSGTAIVNAR